MAKRIAYLLGLVLLVAVSASAQVTHEIKVLVPFPFAAGGEKWQAGVYEMELDGDTGAVILGTKGSARKMVLSYRTQTPQAIGRDSVRFRHFGEHWVLQQIVVDGITATLKIDKLEKELMAINKPSEDKVLLAKHTQ
jgi:hypothetical protein